MSSQSKKSWKNVFNLRPGGPSLASPETGGTTSEKDGADECDSNSTTLTRPPSYQSQISAVEPSRRGELSKDQIYCSACRTQHPLSSFHNTSIEHLDQRRRCIGSERVLYLCAHAFMTWDQFRREIVDIFPYHKGYPSAPTVLTITYARDSELSIRDAVMRHKFGSHCQAWEGEFYGTAKSAPYGQISFQMKEENEILWYSPWHIPVLEVWCKEKEIVVEGTGPSPEKFFETAEPGSKTQDSRVQSSEGESSQLASKNPITAEQGVPLLAERLSSFEIYLCPHVNFFSPILKPSLIFLLATKFVGGNQSTLNSNCSKCGAWFNIFVQQKCASQVVDHVVIIVARNIGAGANAMEQEWLNATEIRVK